MDYKSSGVNIQAADRWLSSIAVLCRATHTKDVLDVGNSFAGCFDLGAYALRHPVLLAATDGVGTKLKLAAKFGCYDGIGKDLVAMCGNDILAQGGKPLFFLDYLAANQLKEDILSTVIKGIADGCREASMSLIGGETAEMPGFYAKDYCELSGFCVGIAEKDQILPQNIAPGDAIIGMPSSGVHANGYSLINDLLEAHPACGSDSARIQQLLLPTSIYVKPLLPLLAKKMINGLAHITGGGLTDNIPRILPEGHVAELRMESWEMPEVFQWIARAGVVSSQEMLHVFNCGIGMVCIVSPSNRQQVQSDLADSGFPTQVIGHVATFPEKQPKVVYL